MAKKARDAAPARRLLDETPAIIRNLKPAEIGRDLETTRLYMFHLLKELRGLVARCELGVAICKDKKDKARAGECLDLCDTWFAEMLHMVSGEAGQRALRSDNPDLIGLASVHCGLLFLPEILERLPQAEWDNPECSDCAGFALLRDLAPVIRFVERDAVQHPERYRLWAREQPFSP